MLQKGEASYTLQRYLMILKEQSHKICDPFSVKNCTWPPYDQAKTDFAKIFVFAKIFAKNVCPRNWLTMLTQYLVDADNAHMMSWTTMQTLC